MFTIVIKTESDAFVEDARGEIARILEDVARQIYQGKEPSSVRDVNGNTCGKITWAI